ncbi:hypothetical protein [Labrenzia sp. 011]|uniref:hypothetical protein n=1 Tax=Labrenzia sp. 011 TaxID=2171494 RepID=UPI0010575E57|nr:hypothetical protein [Labrenzia sp. 011]
MIKTWNMVAVLCVLLLGLAACQSGGQAGGGLEDGSAAPGMDIVLGNEGPDGPPGECESMSEGTSTTDGCP